ncbi:YihY/virulence factor BrkB family protein [Halostella sp. JP-L12]|uniref:YihY/virulence factor BrkB family protein n=1 Tax=Halostella TaxID=1843185 RepID=UPI000EF7B652|nr:MULTISPECIES: YihY/virulence factor BrkB family protein [Halostella]NHN46823.1 YihY/virulence factor BrkB family protein [Halostella sp. JP-L12]
MGDDRLDRALDTVVTVIKVAYEKDVRYPAAAMAYYAFVSFVPVLLLVFAVVGDQVLSEVETAMPQFLTIEARRLVYEATTTASGQAGGSVLAAGVIAWSGANVATDFQTVVERVEASGEKSLREQLRDSAVVLASLGLAILAILLTSLLFTLPPEGSFAGLVILFIALTVAFLPLYYVPSTVLPSPEAALPGAITAAFGWTVIHTAILFYAANAAQYAIYGVLSGIIIILTSLYIAASILMTGVIVNATVADRADTREVSDVREM